MLRNNKKKRDPLRNIQVLIFLMKVSAKFIGMCIFKKKEVFVLIELGKYKKHL